MITKALAKPEEIGKQVDLILNVREFRWFKTGFGNRLLNKDANSSSTQPTQNFNNHQKHNY